MGRPIASPLPADSQLANYRTAGAYTDCLMLDVAGGVTLAELIEAFYTSRAFRPERLLLSLIGKASNNDDARRLAAGEVESFAAWTVEARGEDQILLCDFQSRTRSWLMVVPQDGGATSRLYQRPYELTHWNHSRLAMDLMVSGRSMRSFQALQQAVTMVSYVS